MKRILAFLFFALISSLATAATLGPSVKLQADSVLRGRFVQEHPVKSGGIVRSEGRFVVAPGRGVLWQIEKPLPISVVVTDRGMTQSVGGVPLLRFTPDKMPLLRDATDLLTAALEGDFAALSPRFTVKTSGKPAAWQAVLIPRGDQGHMPFTRITAHGGAYVNDAKIARPDGLTDGMAFSDQSVTRGGLADDEALLFDAAQKPLGR